MRGERGDLGVIGDIMELEGRFLRKARFSVSNMKYWILACASYFDSKGLPLVFSKN